MLQERFHASGIFGSRGAPASVQIPNAAGVPCLRVSKAVRRTSRLLTLSSKVSSALPDVMSDRSSGVVPVPLPVNAAELPVSAAELPVSAAEEPQVVEWEGEVRAWSPKRSAPRVEANQHAPPIVILPGFGNNAADYAAPFGNEEASLVAALKRRGFRPYVLNLERRDWLRVGRAFASRAYWAGHATTDEGYRWYLERVAALVDTARLECKSDQVDLVAHSAGGWLARAFLGDAQWQSGERDSSDAGPNPAIRSLVTLGSPHRPPPPGKHRDMTGGALKWVDTQWPGAYFADEGVRYICVAGRAVRGDAAAKRKTLSRYAHDTYTMVCGDGHGVEGDCVVPTISAHLEGANNILLDGVLHSMSKIGSYSESTSFPWYGTCEVVDHWAAPLADPTTA